MQILREMHDATVREDFENAEIVCEGIECWLGIRRVACVTVDMLLRLVCLSEDSENKVRRYTINGTGEAVLRRPELVEEIAQALVSRKPFSIKNDQVKYLQ